MSRFLTYAMPESTTVDLYALRGQIGLSPFYQRNSDIWNPRKRRLLIDSILNRYDIPKLYLQHYNVPTMVGKSKKKVTYAIIDGKQRLEAIWGFMGDEFALDNDFEYYNDPEVKAGGLKYSELANRCPPPRVQITTAAPKRAHTTAYTMQRHKDR